MATSARPRDSSRRKILYLAHKVRPLEGSDEDLEGNLLSAMQWLAFLRKSEPDITIICPWLVPLLSGAAIGDDDSDPASREAGLVDCETVVARCDGIVLTGGRISSGIARELAVVEDGDGEIHDLLALGPIAPEVPNPGVLMHVERITRSVVLENPSHRSAALTPRCAVCGAMTRCHGPNGEHPAAGEWKAVAREPRVVASARQCDQLHAGMLCQRPYGHVGEHVCEGALRVSRWTTDPVPA